MESLVQDIKYGVRVLLQNPGLTIVAMLALTLGIGANTAIFSVVNTVLLKPLPYPQPDRLVRVHEKSPQFDTMSIAYPNFLDWQKLSQSFEGLAAFRNDGFNITGSGTPERVQGRVVSASFFSTLGVSPAMGRDFVAEDDRPGAAPTVIIGNALWQRNFGRDSEIVGKPLKVNGKDHTIIGVMPATFRFYSASDLFVPIGLADDMTMRDREVHPGIKGVARLKPGVSIEQAQAEMDGIAGALSDQYPASNKNYGVALFSMYEDVVGDIRPALLIMLGAVCFVLLIACANVANLLLARAAARQREIAIRTALGASRVRIVRQLLTESVLLAVAGGAFGLLLASWGTGALISAIPDTIPRAEDIGVDRGVLAFTFAVSLITGIVFGLVPALQASNPDLNEALKEGGRGSTAGRHRVRGVLVAAEVALALVLLVGAGLMIRSIVLLKQVAPGLDPHNVLLMDIPLASAKYEEPAAIRTFFRQLIERAESAPLVQAAAIANDLPLNDSDSELPFWTGNRPRPAPEDMSWALIYPSTAGYLKAMGTPLLRGRFLTDQDNETSSKVVVVDEALARGLFPDEDAVGKLLTIQGFGNVADMPCQIVGVVGHVKHWGLDADPKQRIQYQLYMPMMQLPDPYLVLMAQFSTLVARTSTEPLSLAAAVKDQVQAIDRDQPVNNIRTMDQAISTTMSQRRFSLLLLGIFAGVALVLAAVGIYGVISYSVTQRTHEIGIRLALGSPTTGVLGMIVRQGMRLVGIGLAVGVISALLLTRLMSSLLYGVSSTDPLTYCAIALVLAAVALGACLVPARRAMKVDPIVALRYE
ncbi:MAG TPA: ABC transporter permease [Blastocatellia bacterium]|nr:ABC transporter permease [Blastocatellia bacterium]